MSEFQMESAQAVNALRPHESAIHSEIYNPSTKWSTFEQMNARSNSYGNANFLEMSDPYSLESTKTSAPELGDPKRVDFRQNNQEHAIFDGVKDGEIDYDEFTNLQQEQDLISQAQQYFGTDGFSQPELQTLDTLQSSARQHIIDAGGADELKHASEPGEEKPGDDNGGSEEHRGKEEHGSEKPHEDRGSEEGGSEEGGKEDSHDKGGENDQPPEPAAEEEQFQQFMNFLDQNGDGNISLEELLQAFQQIDENHDGVISPEELQKFMQKLAEQSKEQSGGKDEPGGEDKPAGSETPGGSEKPGGGNKNPTEGGDNPPEIDPAEQPKHGSLDDALAQNDFDRRGLVVADAPFHGKNGAAYGKHDGWIQPKEGVFNTAPWGVVYPEEGKTVDPEATVQVKDAATYYHLKGGGWVEAQSPSDSNWWEGNYRPDFKNNESTPGKGRQQLADGTYQFDSPPVGRNDHFGPGTPALKYDTNKYDGFFTTYSARTDKDNSGLVMQIGMDHKDQKIVSGEHSYSPAFGGSNWTRLTTDWQPLYYTSLDANTFKDDPPPGIA